MKNKARYELQPKSPIRIITYHFINHSKIWRHWHEYLEIIYLVKGGITVKIGNKTFDVRENDIVVFNDFEVHESISLSEENEYYVFVIPPEFFKAFDENERYVYKNIIRNDEGCLYLAKKAAMIVDKNGNNSPFLLNARIFELLHKMTESYSKHDTKAVQQTKEAKYVVDDIKNRIDCCYAEPLDINMLANSLCISTSHLQHTFKQQTGHSIVGYINKVRVENAARLLEETTLRVSEVSCKVGFSDYNYFSRVFKKMLGYTPTDYRLEKCNIKE